MWERRTLAVGRSPFAPLQVPHRDRAGRLGDSRHENGRAFREASRDDLQPPGGTPPAFVQSGGWELNPARLPLARACFHYTISPVHHIRYSSPMEAGRAKCTSDPGVFLCPTPQRQPHAAGADIGFDVCSPSLALRPRAHGVHGSRCEKQVPGVGKAGIRDSGHGDCRLVIVDCRLRTPRGLGALRIQGQSCAALENPRDFNGVLASGL